MAVRTNMRLADQRHTAELEAARDAAEAEALRTLAAPDAGPDQCPVCGGEELAELADDDELLGGVRIGARSCRTGRGSGHIGRAPTSSPTSRRRRIRR